MKTANSYGSPSMGCYFDHANYTVDELNRRILRLAESFGRADPQDSELIEKDLTDLTEDDIETLNYSADAAIDWLNEQETRSFMYWSNDGDANAFGLWCNVDGAREDCAFVSCESQSAARRHEMDCDPDDSSCPAADYRGEWLHVSDHGNATLYVREDSAGAVPGYKDTEIWGVV